MRIIEPIEITDPMVGSGAGTVPEGDYGEFSLTTEYNYPDRVILTNTYGDFCYAYLDEPSGLGYNHWQGMCISYNGTFYASADFSTANGKIYTWNGTDWVALQSIIDLKGMCAAPNGDIYVCKGTVNGVGDIYIRTGGSGSFTALSQSDVEWRGICADANGNIFACVYGGDIYKRTLGAGNFSALSIGNKNWSAMCYDSVADVIYATVYGGDIWYSDDGGATFNAIADTDRDWNAITADVYGNIYAAVYNGDIYKRTGGAGTFAATGGVTRNWSAMTTDPTTHHMYGAEYTGTEYIFISKYPDIHKIYESISDSNLGNYPPADVLLATPNWLEISATNKWKVFDGKVVDQMSTPSPAVYTITPGEAFNSVVLLNLEATSVTIAVDTTPAYSQTVATGATDIVKMDIAGLSTNIITITITNSAGLAKCGEIIVGSYYELGTLRPYPNVGIIDYSIKEQDEWGNWSITERAYSEKMNADVNVTYSSLDAVIAKLKDYRATPVVWIGSSSYSCLIVYGFVKDWSVPVSTRGKSILSLQIEGLT